MTEAEQTWRPALRLGISMIAVGIFIGVLATTRLAVGDGNAAVWSFVILSAAGVIGVGVAMVRRRLVADVEGLHESGVLGGPGEVTRWSDVAAVESRTEGRLDHLVLVIVDSREQVVDLPSSSLPEMVVWWRRGAAAN